jgi:hypothetical protein
MYVDLAIHLFFPPDIELDEDELTGAGLREYAADLAERLSNVGAVVDKLRATAGLSKSSEIIWKLVTRKSILMPKLWNG